MLQHGTRHAYIMGCREADCREANALYHRQRREQWRWRTVVAVHGRYSTYVNKSCRCLLCSAEAHRRWVKAAL